MPIGIIRPRRRKLVGWLRIDPPVDARKAFEERGFGVKTFSVNSLLDHANISGLAAVIFTQRPDKLQQIIRDFAECGRKLLDYECTIVFRPAPRILPPGAISNIVSYLLRSRLFTANLPANVKDRAIWQNREGDPPTPHVRIYEGDDWNVLANFISENLPGEPPNSDLKITFGEEFDRQGNSVINRRWERDYDLLIRRAFYNCKEVHLVPMTGGRSGVDVYRAYPELMDDQNPVSLPLPHFVKIGNRRKIFDEYNNYRDWVEPYVPFHLGPHLNYDRCCLGDRKGVLVGDYIEASESLVDCARGGRSSGAIACLFDRTLHGWYRGGKEVNTALATLLNRQLPMDISPDRLDQARNLGASKDLQQLKALFNQCNSLPVLTGPIHGDLHAGNVRVRGNDAILIDFLAHRFAPLLWDVASLEASLLVEGFAEDSVSTKWDPKAWLSSISSLYEGTSFPISPPHANPKNISSWFHECVRQIRHYAQRTERAKDQYAGALAVALLAKASKDPGVPEPEASRHVGAYVMAEKILTGTFHIPVLPAAGNVVGMP